MLRNYILFLLVLFCSILLGQKREPNMGIGLSLTTNSFYYPNGGWSGQVIPTVQINYTYLPRPSTMISGAIGGGLLSLRDNKQLKPQFPIWTTFNYLRITNYDKRKKVHFVYGGCLDIGLGEFLYAHDGNLGAPRPLYKRLLMAVSPQLGTRIKTSTKSFLTTTLSVGGAFSFSKINHPPIGSYYYSKIILPLSFRISYNFLFNSKRR